MSNTGKARTVIVLATLSCRPSLTSSSAMAERPRDACSSTVIL